jgi:hypothetical protein
VETDLREQSPTPPPVTHKLGLIEPISEPCLAGPELKSSPSPSLLLLFYCFFFVSLDLCLCSPARILLCLRERGEGIYRPYRKGGSELPGESIRELEGEKEIFLSNFSLDSL